MTTIPGRDSVGKDSQADPVRNVIGRVISISGAQSNVGLTGVDGKSRATVGNFLSIQTGNAVTIGMVTEIAESSPPHSRENGYTAVATIDLVGEIKDAKSPSAYFQRGVTEYPSIGNSVLPITEAETRLLYDIRGNDSIKIGTLHEDGGGDACINVDEMITKHFSILGTTGVGKSSGVAILLQQVLTARPNLRIFLVDPHNEYARCFGEKAVVMTPRNLRLPFWLFSFEEIVDVFFGARPGIDEEMQVLAEAIPLAKSAYLQYRNSNDRTLAKKKDARATGFTADTPVPYRIEDLVNMIDEQMGKLENRTSRMVFHKLITRIQTVRNDPRYSFMFENANIGGDTMAEVLSHLFRLPPNGKPMTIMQLAGFPAEVVDSVVSVLCRMAFDFGLWSDGVAPLLFVCEEAHRYAPADRKIGFGPTRRALSRIAKEGRKYGVFLGLVTQRPAEIDPTIISQCSTLFVMRMANDRDQELVRSAVSDAAANLLTFIPSLGTREVFAFGVGVSVPTRLRFHELAANVRPQSEAGGSTQSDAGGAISRDLIGSVIDRWRSATMSQKNAEDIFTSDPGFPAEAVPLQPAPAPLPPPLPTRITPTLSPRAPTALPSLDTAKFSLLRKDANLGGTPAAQPHLSQPPLAPAGHAPLKPR
jgi:DNA helicase HerA-like ATPase